MGGYKQLYPVVPILTHPYFLTSFQNKIKARYMDISKYTTFMKAAAQIQKMKKNSKKSVLARTTLDTKKLTEDTKTKKKEKKAEKHKKRERRNIR
jgi:hypothetical protein